VLTQVPDAEPRLHCRRHAALLAAAILGIALPRFLSTHTPIALAFACYGALHGASVVIGLRPRPARLRALGFVAAAALLSGVLARLGLLAAPLLVRNGVDKAALLVVAASAGAGALGYATLLRWLLRYRLAPGPVVMIALVCACAASAALVPLRRYPVGGAAWLAMFWWVSFSAGLCAAAGRRARLSHEPPDATRPQPTP
jgi:hypothetical protein